MALADTITTDDADGTDVVYSLTGRALNESARRAAGDTNSEPKLLVVKHQTQGKGNATVDRHLVQFSKTFIDDQSIPRTGLVNVTIVQPRTSEFTEQVMLDMTSEAISLLSGRGFSATTGLTSTSVILGLLKSET